MENEKNTHSEGVSALDKAYSEFVKTAEQDCLVAEQELEKATARIDRLIHSASEQP